MYSRAASLKPPIYTIFLYICKSIYELDLKHLTCFLSFLC
ncbi:hypothetical protein X975_19272, partial [Stegodyphus mimosarum]